jgi:hypothetical protein
LFLIYENQRKEDSFYEPYISILEDPFSIIHWDETMRNEL